MDFFDLPPKTLVIIGTLISLIIIDDLDAPRQNSLGNFLQLIGQALESSAAQQNVQDNKSNKLFERLEKLEREMQNLGGKINKVSNFNEN